MTDPRKVPQPNSNDNPADAPMSSDEESSDTLHTSAPQQKKPEEIESLPPLDNPWETSGTLSSPGTKPIPGTSATFSFPGPENASSLSFPMKAGRYLLTKEIAHGGMGAILLAEDEQFHRPLAIKVLLGRISSSSPTGARFFEEAQVMGQLQHPGIPPVHELGELPDGRPFFAMKLIQGETLSDQLKRRSDASENLPHFLDVFEQICQTMGYAHAQGVIHRDLKPSNVMVGAFGEVQVMDWGLAKVLQQSDATHVSESVSTPSSPIQTVRSSGASTETYAGSVMGTPAYMPPEQARGEIENLDERADVFGLGAIFCEILTGKPPYVGGSALEQAQEADLKSAFTALDECGADEELIRLCKACLSESRHERPKNGAELADQISHYQAQLRERLHQEQVQRVQADEEQKRLQLKVTEERRRRRISLALALLGVLFILALSGAGFWYVQNRAEQRLAEQKRLREKEVAEKRIVTSVNNAEASRKQLVADLRNPKGFHKLMSQPARWEQRITNCEASINEAGGIIRGNPELIDEQLRQQVETLQKQIRTERSNFDAAQMLDEARMKASALVEGNYNPASALPEYRKAFHDLLGMDVEKGDPEELAKRIREKSIHLVLVAHLDHWALSVIHPDEKHLKEVRQRLIQLADRADEKNEWRAQFRNACLNQSTTRLRELGETFNPDEQNPYVTASFVEQLYLYQLQSPKLIDRLALHYVNDFWTQFTLGLIAKEPADSIAFNRAALAARESPIAYNNLALAYHKQGDPDKAIGYYLKAIHLDPDNGTAHGNLISAYAQIHDLDKAMQHFQKAIQLDPKSTTAHVNVGYAYERVRKLDKAMDHFKAALKIDPKLARAHTNLGYAFRQKGDLDQALTHFQAALKIDDSGASAHNDLGLAWLGKGELNKASQAFQDALKIDSGYAKAWYNLGLVHRRNKDVSKAILHFRTALRHDPKLADAHNDLALGYYDRGELDRAIEECELALRLNPNFAKAHNNLGLVYRKQGKLTEAVLAFHEAHRLEPKLLAPVVNLGSIYLGAGRFADARKYLKLTLQLLPADHPSRSSVTSDLEECERLSALETKLKLVDEKKTYPDNVEDLLALGRFCLSTYVDRYLQAFYFYQAAFAKDRTQAKKLDKQYRYYASCSALLAASGDGKDAGSLSDQERSQLRKEALKWLQADLAAYQVLAKDNDRKLLDAIVNLLTRWQNASALESIREPELLKKLPQDEQPAWNKLWEDHRNLLRTITDKK